VELDNLCTYCRENTDRYSSLTELAALVTPRIIYHGYMVHEVLHTWHRVGLHRLYAVVLYVAAINALDLVLASEWLLINFSRKGHYAVKAPNEEPNIRFVA
jgi:hypothetical protein